MTAKEDLSREVVQILKAAPRVMVLSGAGISAESGVPTFREAQIGLWAQYDPQELATPQSFQKNPKLVWDWYTWRRELITSASPNSGHLALVEMESCFTDFTLVTQNVDGLHQRAGSHTVVELHGNIFRTKCARENRVISTSIDSSASPPICPDCGSYLRPDVVWFGESLPAEALAQALNAVNVCEVFISVGTSALVEPAATLPFIALEKGALLLEINPHETPLTPAASYVLRGNAGEILPRLTAELVC